MSTLGVEQFPSRTSNNVFFKSIFLATMSSLACSPVIAVSQNLTSCSYRPASCGAVLKSLPFVQNLFRYKTPGGSTISGADSLIESWTLVLTFHLITLVHSTLATLAPLLKMEGRC